MAATAHAGCEVEDAAAAIAPLVRSRDFVYKLLSEHSDEYHLTDHKCYLQNEQACRCAACFEPRRSRSVTQLELEVVHEVPTRWLRSLLFASRPGGQVGEERGARRWRDLVCQTPMAAEPGR